MKAPLTLEQRFWNKVDKNGPIHPYNPELGSCWVWTAYAKAHNSGPYGRIFADGRVKPATHVAHFLATGSWISDEYRMLHSCDNSICVRFSHLFVGTMLDNNLDCISKGRNKPQTNNKYSAKVSPDTVRTIRSLYQQGGMTQREIANRFNLAQASISLITQNKIWRDVA